MIHSVDTYLKRVVKDTLKALLAKSYILNDVILEDFPKDVKKPFINTFCTDKGNAKHPIPVTLTYNPNKLDPRASILIQFEGGNELVNKDQALGMNMGTTTLNDEQIHREALPLLYDKDNKLAYFKPSHKATRVINIDRFDGRTEIVDGRIYEMTVGAVKNAQADYLNDDYKKDISTVTYASPSPIKHNTHRSYELVGYDAAESFTIEAISNNMDTIRCLIAIIQSIAILARLQTVEENDGYYLGKIKIHAPDQIRDFQNSKNSTFGQQIYRRQVEVNFIITNTLPNKYGLLVKNIMPKLNKEYHSNGDPVDVHDRHEPNLHKRSIVNHYPTV